MTRKSFSFLSKRTPIHFLNIFLWFILSVRSLIYYVKLVLMYVMRAILNERLGNAGKCCRPLRVLHPNFVSQVSGVSPKWHFYSAGKSRVRWSVSRMPSLIPFVAICLTFLRHNGDRGSALDMMPPSCFRILCFVCGLPLRFLAFYAIVYL